MDHDHDERLGDLLYATRGVFISPGAPCKCGPGFCASRPGVGFYGYCAGSARRESAPDCPLCGAPAQSTLGCWCCSVRGGNDPSELALEAAARARRVLAKEQP